VKLQPVTDMIKRGDPGSKHMQQMLYSFSVNFEICDFQSLHHLQMHSTLFTYKATNISTVHMHVPNASQLYIYSRTIVEWYFSDIPYLYS